MPASGPPALGRPFELELHQALAGSLTLGVFGWSQMSQGSTQLPASLAGMGMPDCFQLIRVHAVLPPFRVVPRPAWSIPIPNDPGWIDITFYMQALMFDPGANPAGAVTSNAVQATIGRL